ncbi:DUF6234 family protein [Streptomyces sp. NPDC002888]|uniref:DUF6234 family protein n=1 Tax=Streptomyces sp. NPDC002888 TaxID=3364668 RepID=UPI0036BAEB3B
MTTSAHEPLDRRRDHLHPVADVALALVLLVVDTGAALWAYLAGMDAAGYSFFDTGADNSDVDMTKPALFVGVVGVVVLGTALLAWKGRAYITAVLQGLAACVLLLVAATGLAEQDKNHPPAPQPGYSGPQTQCLSGGDNSECHGS